MKISALRGFSPEGGHMKAESRLSSGSPRDHARLNRDSIRIERVHGAMNRFTGQLIDKQIEVVNE